MTGRLWHHWKLLLVVTVVAGAGIQAFEPDWNDLQMADDADAYRAILDSTGRATAAALCDVVFAAGYGLLGVAGVRSLGGRARVAIAAAGAIALGALADEVENLFMIRNINSEGTLTDGWVDAMQVFGTIKWIGALGFLYFFFLLIRRALDRRATAGGP